MTRSGSLFALALAVLLPACAARGPELPTPDQREAAVVTTPLAEPRIRAEPNDARFFQTVAAGFSQKRKQLHNALGSLGVGTERIQAALTEAQIEPSRRAETLTLEEWSRLSSALWPE